MNKKLFAFEKIVRKSAAYAKSAIIEECIIHPFDERDIHPKLPPEVRSLFDDGHFSQASFEAFKYIDKLIQQLSRESETGYKLMMNVFSEKTPKIKLTPCSSNSEKDEQMGYRFLFAGSILAIRNPRGHEYGVEDDPDMCLDHLSLASLLLRRIEKAGHKLD